MREESHLDDMRAAIRGDFERLEERRGGQELMRPVIEPEPEPEPEPQALGHPRPEPQVPREPVRVEELPDDPLQQPVTRDDLTEPPERPPRRSWLDRLLGR